MKLLKTSFPILNFTVTFLIVLLSGYYFINNYFLIEEQRFYYQLQFSRFSLLLFLIPLFLYAFSQFKSFLQTPGNAINLAVFRIVYFGFFFLGSFFYLGRLRTDTLAFVNLPVSSRISMPFMDWFINFIPINGFLVTLFVLIYFLSITGSFIGFKTKWSIVLFVISGFYLFCIPNFYGKINHNHHIIWFAAVLAYSPCADVFSIDAWRRKKSNKSLPLRNPIDYALPFRIIWLLMGIIYFFPGFWKLWSSGLDWALTDNVRNQMYYKWFQLSDWLPLFRLDHYPILYKSSGVFTILFELTFIFLILSKKTRKIAVLGGILFHLGTMLFMNIFFAVLLLSYVSFINWEKILLKIKPSISNIKQSVNTNYKKNLVVSIGAILILGNLIFGLGKWHGYPFSCYPTFDSLIPAETESLYFSGISTGNKIIVISKDIFKEKYSSERFWNIENSIIHAYKQGKIKEKEETIDALIKLISTENLSIMEIKLFLNYSTIIPEEKNCEIQSTLIYNWKKEH